MVQDDRLGKPIQEILVVLIGLINANQRKLLRIEIRRYWSLEVGRLDLLSQLDWDN